MKSFPKKYLGYRFLERNFGSLNVLFTDWTGQTNFYDFRLLILEAYNPFFQKREQHNSQSTNDSDDQDHNRG